MNKKFKELVDQILSFRWQTYPTEATYLGIHDFDSQLEKTDQQSRQMAKEANQKYLEKLQNFSGPDLDDGEKMDWKILAANLEAEIKLEEEHKKFERDAGIYPELAATSCYILLLREFAPLKVRLQSLQERLEQIPRFLEEGKENLRKGGNIPHIWTEVAIDVAQSSVSFFEGMVPEAANQVSELRQSVLQANQVAIQALKDYERFVRQEILPRSNGSFALGKELFEFLLLKMHGLPYDTDYLCQTGNRVIRETTSQLEQLAAQIDGTKSWEAILDQLKGIHPQPEELLDFYQKEMAYARDFVRSKDLASIPDREELKIIETPVFYRAIIPYAAYLPPPAFEERQVGYYWVTPVNRNATLEQQQEQLEGHSSFKATVTSLHEAYPGHHLQLLWANRVDSKVRRTFWTSVFAEGWALYCEELMYEEGFYSDPRTRLVQLRDQLWRACRVVIDVSLHSGKMSFQEAVDMLVDVAKLEKSNAIAEVKRYTKEPTQPMSYLMGKLEILKLREDYRKKKGAEFNLKEFHNRLLSYGTIPVQMVRENMLGN